MNPRPYPFFVIACGYVLMCASITFSAQWVDNADHFIGRPRLKPLGAGHVQVTKAARCCHNTNTMTGKELGEQFVSPTYFKDGEVNSPGLTRRELFAAMALQGLLASRFIYEETLADLATMEADMLLERLAREEGK